MLKEAILNPYCVKVRTDSHEQKMKNYFANVSKVQFDRMKTFVKATISQIHMNNGRIQLTDDFMVENEDLIRETVGWTIFQLENNTLKLNCKH